jgi:hypothetical protein
MRENGNTAGFGTRRLRNGNATFRLRSAGRVLTPKIRRKSARGRTETLKKGTTRRWRILTPPKKRDKIGKRRRRSRHLTFVCLLSRPPFHAAAVCAFPSLHSEAFLQITALQPRGMVCLCLGVALGSALLLAVHATRCSRVVVPL